MFEHEERDGVLVLRMAHGKASALDLELLEGLEREVGELARSDARAVVVTGRGAIFSAGVDLVRLRDGGAEYVRRFLPALDRAFSALFRLEKPVVAAVNGHAVAGGCVIACACDRRLMARGKGRIGAPELRVGVPFPPLALEIVRRVAGCVDEVALWGGTYAPERALELGLVDELCEAGELVERAVGAARVFASMPPRSFALTKRAARLPHLDLLERHGEALSREVAETWTSPEVLGAVDAYVRETLGK